VRAHRLDYRLSAQLPRCILWCLRWVPLLGEAGGGWDFVGGRTFAVAARGFCGQKLADSDADILPRLRRRFAHDAVKFLGLALPTELRLLMSPGHSLRLREGGTCEYRRARRSGTYAMDLYQVCVRAFATRQRPTGGGGGGGQPAAPCQRFHPTATRPILRLPAHPASSWRVWRQGLALGVCVCVHNAKAAVEGGPAG
jgi:hypothetical protein